MRTFICIFAVVLVVSVQPTLATIHEINVSDSFAPTATTVSPGDTVRWVFVSGTHSILSDVSSPKSFASPELSTPGEAYEVVFGYTDGPGPFPYHCGIHPTVVDTIFTTDICIAGFDINGDGYPLSVSDLIYLLRSINDILTGVVPIPDNLYEADINGDCVVDGNDIDLLVDYFTHGIPEIVPWPVPTCCYPSLAVGACCVGDSCSIRSEDHCIAMGGIYGGIGSTCDPNPCTCCVLRGDVNHDGVIDVSDLICMVETIFCFSGNCCEIVCADEVDINGDGSYDISDLVYMVEYMFMPGAPTPAPCSLKN